MLVCVVRRPKRWERAHGTVYNVEVAATCERKNDWTRYPVPGITNDESSEYAHVSM